MTILVILLAFGLSMLLVKFIGLVGSIIGAILKGIVYLITFPFRLIGYVMRKL